MVPISRATAFIDWNSMLRRQRGSVAANNDVPDETAICSLAFERTARRIATVLTDVERATRFIVTLRLYHGWHKGFQPTQRRRIIAKIIAQTDFSVISPYNTISFLPEVEYGDKLIFASDFRMHSKLQIHLPGTLRDRPDSSGEWNSLEEKMVDTALTADVVSLALTEPDRWLIIVGEDDDLIPAAFTAEGLRSRGEKRVRILRHSNHHGLQKLDHILVTQ
jgi:hypothetical protein